MFWAVGVMPGLACLPFSEKKRRSLPRRCEAQGLSGKDLSILADRLVSDTVSQSWKNWVETQLQDIWFTQSMSEMYIAVPMCVHM